MLKAALEAVTQVDKPVPAFFRIPCGVEVVAIKHVFYTDLGAKPGGDGQFRRQVHGRQTFAIMRIEQGLRCGRIRGVLQSDSAFIVRGDDAEYLVG